MQKKNPKSYLQWGLSLGQLPFHSDTLLSELTWHSCFFSDFVFKIRLIRLGFLCKQKKPPVYELTIYRFLVKSHITIAPKSQL